jgi:hypothetical protein
MLSIHLKYQTSKLVPPPFAYAIEFSLNKEEGSYTYALTYLDRELCTLEELEEEGFTENDNENFSGKMAEVWHKEIEHLFSQSKPSKKSHIHENEDFLVLSEGNNEFYPQNAHEWIAKIEDLRQAIFEEQKVEAPLIINISRQDLHENRKYQFTVSFLEKTIKLIKEKDVLNLEWAKKNDLLNDIFKAQFIEEKVSKKIPNKTGFFISFEAEKWYELGYSYINRPSAITKWLE